MAFDSYKYLLFLPVVLSIFYCMPDRFRWLLLLLASLCFYAFLQVPYLLLTLCAVIMITYGCGILIENTKAQKIRRLLFWIGVLSNILILGYLKYLSFLIFNLNDLFSLLSLNTSLTQSPDLIFVGVSFYVFQAISYLSDVYLEVAMAERHFGYFALYMSFFPKLLLGPIERCADLIHQFRKKYEFKYDNMRTGLLMCAWGLFKKLVIADQLGVYVDSVYGDVHSYAGLPLIFATYFYAIQIYADFSGYIDIARGSAKMFNIHLTENFKSPYLATSIADFWRRWHITLYRWLLDYVFKPLQMKFRTMKNWGTVCALLITLLLSGIWHGAARNFILWGMLFGAYLSCSVFYRQFQRKMYATLSLENTRTQRLFQIFVTFHLICFAWIFFRSPSCENIFYVITHLHTGIMQFLGSAIANITVFHNLKQLMLPITLNSPKIFLGYLICIGIIMFEQIVREKRGNFFLWLLAKPKSFRWSIYVVLLVSIINLGKTSDIPFVYFDF